MRRQPDADLAAELSPEQQSDLGDLSGVQESLARYVVPRPSPEETGALLARLRPLVAARAAGADARAAQVHTTVRTPAPAPEPDFLEDAPLPAAQRGVRGWLDLARSQTSLLESSFWWASGLVFTVGLLAGLTQAGRPYSLILAFLSPVLAAAGVAYAFRPSLRSLGEMERACPINPLELVYARLGLVLAFNLVLSLALLTMLAATEPGLVLWRLVAAWLGPMLALAGVALYTTVRWGAVAGAASPLTLWAALLLGLWQAAGRETPDLPNLLQERLVPVIGHSNAMLAASLAALALGLLLLRHAGRRALGDDAAWN
jgi:hypothetical protein